MFADGGHTHTKQQDHRFLRSPYRFILYHRLHPAFLIRQMSKTKELVLFKEQVPLLPRRNDSVD